VAAFESYHQKLAFSVLEFAPHCRKSGLAAYPLLVSPFVRNRTDTMPNLNVTLNLYEPEAMDAFGHFCAELARITRASAAQAGVLGDPRVVVPDQQAQLPAPIPEKAGRRKPAAKTEPPPPAEVAGPVPAGPAICKAGSASAAPVGRGLASDPLDDVAQVVALNPPALTQVEARLRLQKVIGDSEDRRKAAAKILSDQFNVQSMALLTGPDIHRFVTAVEATYA